MQLTEDGVIQNNVNTVEKPQAMRVEEPDVNTTYQGWAVLGASQADAVWRIRRIVKDGTATPVTWADGNKKYDNIWDNFASLSYS